MWICKKCNKEVYFTNVTLGSYDCKANKNLSQGTVLRTSKNEEVINQSLTCGNQDCLNINLETDVFDMSIMDKKCYWRTK